jgi:uncharacterized protein YijF (DUF1287 family)
MVKFEMQKHKRAFNLNWTLLKCKDDYYHTRICHRSVRNLMIVLEADNSAAAATDLDDTRVTIVENIARLNLHC